MTVRAAGTPSNYLGAYTFATLPTASTVGGYMARVTDVGPSGFGSMWVSNGTRWSPLGGTVNIAFLAATTSAINNTETVVSQFQMPAGLTANGDIIRVWFSGTKSGTTDAANTNIRVGTAGTNADTIVWTGTGVVSAASTSYSLVKDIKRISATSVQEQGVPANGFSGTGAGAQQGAATVTNLDSNAMYVSLLFASAGATNTVAATEAVIQLITP